MNRSLPRTMRSSPVVMGAPARRPAASKPKAGLTGADIQTIMAEHRRSLVAFIQAELAKNPPAPKSEADEQYEWRQSLRNLRARNWLNGS